MKPLTTVPDSSDRISTAEELQLVVGVLIDLNCGEGVEMVHVADSQGAFASAISGPWMDLGQPEEPSALSDSAELVSLFCGTRERTN